MDKDFMLNYFNKAVQPEWEELLKTGFAPFVGGPAARLLNRGTGRRKAQKGQQREFQTFAQNHGDRIFSYGNKYTNFFRMTKKRPKKF